MKILGIKLPRIPLIDKEEVKVIYKNKRFIP
jgi:hypothetical protein